MHGIDTAGEAIKRAASNNPTVQYQSYDGRTLPFADGELDLAFAINVVHHVPPAERAPFASELRRVVRPDGLAVVFEQNPLNPLTRLAVSRCEFDAGVVLLTQRSLSRLLAGTGLDAVEQRYIIFSMSDRPRVRAVERSLGWLPLGAQHYVAGAAIAATVRRKQPRPTEDVRDGGFVARLLTTRFRMSSTDCSRCRNAEG